MAQNARVHPRMKGWLNKTFVMQIAITVKPYTTIELCHLYDITYKTLNAWLVPFRQEIGEKRGRYFTVIQVEIIFDRLGVPYQIIDGV